MRDGRRDRQWFLDRVLFRRARAAARDRAAGTAPGLHEAPRPTPLLKRLAARRRVARTGHAWRSIAIRPADHHARELAFVVALLAWFKAIGAARPDPATVNDVLLATIAGGLRTQMAGSMAHRCAQIPVSLHHRDESAVDAGNRDSFLNIDLPVDEPNPLIRLDRISAETRRRKRPRRRRRDKKPTCSTRWAVHGLPAPCKVAGRSSPREFGLSISNVPDPARR